MSRAEQVETARGGEGVGGADTGWGALTDDRQRADHIHTCRAAGLEMSTTGLLNVFVSRDCTSKRSPTMQTTTIRPWLVSEIPRVEK